MRLMTRCIYEETICEDRLDTVAKSADEESEESDKEINFEKDSKKTEA